MQYCSNISPDQYTFIKDRIHLKFFDFALNLCVKNESRFCVSVTMAESAYLIRHPSPHSFHLLILGSWWGLWLGSAAFLWACREKSFSGHPTKILDHLTLTLPSPRKKGLPTPPCCCWKGITPNLTLSTG